MSDMPGYIYADPPQIFDGCDIWHSEPADRRTEYIRCDLALAIVKAELRACIAICDDLAHGAGRGIDEFWQGRREGAEIASERIAERLATK